MYLPLVEHYCHTLSYAFLQSFPHRLSHIPLVVNVRYMVSLVRTFNSLGDLEDSGVQQSDSAGRTIPSGLIYSVPVLTVLAIT